MCSPRALYATMILCVFFTLVLILNGCGEESNKTPIKNNSNSEDKPNIVVPLYSSFTIKPSFVVYKFVDGSIDESAKVVLALWDDGRVVWSSNKGTSGGPPYMEATVDRAKIADNLKKIIQLTTKTFGAEEVDLVHFGPDSSHMVMLIAAPPKTIRLRSWHELYEDDANIVVTDKGVEMLNDRSKDSVMKQASPEYQVFLEVWTTIREIADSLVPLEGKENKTSTFSTRLKGD